MLGRVFDRSLDSLIDDFKEDPDIFRTESDVKCHLYHKLILNRVNPTAVMTEQDTRKRGKSRKYRKFDICITGPDKYPLIAVEFKFNVVRGLRKSKKPQSVYMDFNKLNRKGNRVNEGHLVVLGNREYNKEIEELYDSLICYHSNSKKMKNTHLHIVHMHEGLWLDYRK